MFDSNSLLFKINNINGFKQLRKTLNFLIPACLQPDGQTLWYFRLLLFDLKELIYKVFKLLRGSMHKSEMLFVNPSSTLHTDKLALDHYIMQNLYSDLRY